MIWCVEDDAGIREIELYALSSTGLEARGFEDGASFWAALQSDRPELVLLDEPTNALDDASVEVLEAEILRMNREASTTFLIASHDRATLEHLCTKILRMEAGHLA